MNTPLKLHGTKNISAISALILYICEKDTLLMTKSGHQARIASKLLAECQNPEGHKVPCISKKRGSF